MELLLCLGGIIVLGCLTKRFAGKKLDQIISVKYKINKTSDSIDDYDRENIDIMNKSK